MFPEHVGTAQAFGVPAVRALASISGVRVVTDVVQSDDPNPAQVVATLAKPFPPAELARSPNAKTVVLASGGRPPPAQERFRGWYFACWSSRRSSG